MQKPGNKDDFLDLVDQAIFETGDVLASAEQEGDSDEFARFVPVYEQLAAVLRRLHAAVKNGSHAFADGQDLPFMPLAQKWGRQIPFFGRVGRVEQRAPAGVRARAAVTGA